jgi:SmpA / OmlA family
MTYATTFRLARWLAIAALVPNAVFAQDSARISRLESEIQQLRSQIDEQNRRLQRLEAELYQRSGTPPVPAQARKPDLAPQGAALASTKPQPWHKPAAWERVEKGMTVEQVTAILGEPSAVESFDAFKTLFYRGAVNGHVNFRDDRVVAVSKPSF